MLRGAIGGTAALRLLAERALGNGSGASYGQVFSEKLGPELRRVDPTIALAVLKSACLDVVRRCFRQRYGTDLVYLLPMNMTGRRVDPTTPGASDLDIPYHQDAIAFPGGWHVVNCWILLSPEKCGNVSPGLEFIKTAPDRLLNIGQEKRSKNYQFLETDHAVVDALIKQHGIWRPSIRLGDALLFDEFALHRTYLAPSHRKPRCSAEIRLIAGTSATSSYIELHCPTAYRVEDDMLVGPSVLRFGGVDGAIIEPVEFGRWRIGG
jgi:hypothetical protein